MAIIANTYVSQRPIDGARNAAAVTPDNSNDLPVFAWRGLYIGVAGDVVVDMIDSGSTILFKAMPVGYYPHIQVRRIRALNTTATNIVALY